MRNQETGSFHRLVRLLRPQCAGLTAALLLGICSTAVDLFQPLAIGAVVASVMSGSAQTDPIVLLTILFVSDLVFGGLELYLIGRVGTSVVLHVRDRMVHSLLRAPLSAVRERQRGDFLSGVVSDTDQLRNSLTQGLMMLTMGLLLVSGSVGMMLFLDPVLTTAAMLCLLVMAAVGALFSRRIRREALHGRQRVAEFGSALERALSALRTVKISRAEEREQDRISGYAHETYRAGIRAVAWESLMRPLVNLGLQVAFALVFTVGAVRIAQGSLNPAGFTAYLLYLFYLISPLVAVMTAIVQLQHGLAALERIEEMTDMPSEPLTQEPSTRAPAEVSGTNGDAPSDDSVLRFENVSFGYQPEQQVLRDVSIRIPRRGLVAIVGPSGAGKSTLFSLAERFWEVSEGRILLNGTDIRAIPLPTLRARIGYVEQDAPVVHGTIRENLCYANPDATDGDLREVIELANLRQWIDGLEAGLDTPVGESGVAISGGQRQRIAIARMLLAKPDVLLLDEVTSHLDAESEFALRKSIMRVARTCVVVSIAHRMSTVVQADRTVVLEGGMVRAVGKHETLVKCDELYRSLVRTQLLLQDDEAPERAAAG